ncbi:MAG: flagellar biosynthesis protein [Clostridiales bacterium]|nr:flagellar biosynthesis protein [Clostridiales bacterium]MBD5098349.1 flagellar biosynthesis protein [Clostridiales bacterium]
MIQRVSGLQRTDAPQARVQQQGQTGGGFGAMLQQELVKSEQPQSVAFSKHAISRAQERGIEVTPDLMDQLAGSVIRAQAKGATNILAMDAEKAFIINVPNAKVITAITQEEMKQNIFTNIDGAVFL